MRVTSSYLEESKRPHMPGVVVYFKHTSCNHPTPKYTIPHVRTTPRPRDALTTVRAHQHTPLGMSSDPHHHPYDPMTALLEIHSAIVSRHSGRSSAAGATFGKSGI